eukprot:43451_1
MSNELQEFLSLLGRIIVWIIEATINLICIAIFLVSLCAIWRTIWILQDIYDSASWSTFREKAIIHLVLNIVDIFVFPFAIVSLLMPTRCCHAITACRKAYNSRHASDFYNYPYEVRMALFNNTWIGLFDLCCLAFGIGSIVIPTRTFAFCRIMWDHFNDYLEDRYCDLRCDLVSNFWLGIVDILVIPQGILSLFIPTRTYHFFQHLNDSASERCYGGTGGSLSYHIGYRWLCLYNFWLGVADILAAICGILSIIMPTRFPTICRSFTVFWQDYLEDDYAEFRCFLFCNLGFALLDFITFLHCLLFPILVIRYFHLKKMDYNTSEVTFSSKTTSGSVGYNYHLRLWIIGHIYKGIVDIIFIPLLVVDMLSIYNAIELYHLIVDESSPNTIRIMIVINFCWLCFDLCIMLPLLLIIFVTVYRIPNVYRQWNLSWHNYYLLRKGMPIVHSAGSSRAYILEQFGWILLDIPCSVMALFVFATVFRANILWNKLRSAAHTTPHQRRIACFYQTLFVLRDLFFLVPFFIIISTLFRAPILILTLMTKLNKPRIDQGEIIHFELARCVLEFPVKGKPLLHIKATKTNHDLTLNEGKCKLFVLGNTLWNAISDIWGAAMSTGAQSMLPNKLWNGHGMNYDDISDHITRFETTIELQTPLIERETILYNTQKVSPDTPFVMQFEHETHGILFILLVKMSHFIDCARSEDGVYRLPKTCFYRLDPNEIDQIRGTEFIGLIDSFYVIVGVQFLKWLNDVVHFVLFLCLVLVPWRFIKCVKKLCTTQYEYNARENEKAIGRLEYLIMIWDKLWLDLFEPMLNDIVKAESHSHDQYGYLSHRQPQICYRRIYSTWAKQIEKDWIDYQNNYIAKDKLCMKLTTYDQIARNIDSKLSALSPVPLSKELIGDFLDLQNILLYLKIMQSSTNILAMDKKLKWEHYAIFSEQIQIKMEYYQNQLRLWHSMIHKTHVEMQQEAMIRSRTVPCALVHKSLSLNYKIIHDSLRKGLVDICILLPLLLIAIGLVIYFVFDYHAIWPMIVVVVAILVLCSYRIVPLITATYKLSKARKRMKREYPDHVVIATRFGFRQILEFQLKELLDDIKLLLLWLLITFLIIITLVRLFEYVSKLIHYGSTKGKTLTLRHAVSIAKDETKQIWRDIIDLFNFIFMWKTYKFAISSLIFGLFLPSAGFLEIFAVLCKQIVPRKIRQICSIILWFGLLGVIIYVTTSMDANATYYYIFCCVTLGIVTAFYVAFFVFMDQSPAIALTQPILHYVGDATHTSLVLWSYPTNEYLANGIRCSWPNIIVICGLIFDTLQLISIMLCMFDMSDPKLSIPANDTVFERMVDASQYILLMNLTSTSFNVLSVVLLVLGAIWLMIISLPLVCEELFHFENDGTFVKSTLWNKSTWLYSKILFVFLLINWMKLFENHTTVSILSLITIIYFWLTSSIVLVYNNIQTRHSQILQSLFIISGVLIAVSSTYDAFVACFMSSIVMLSWHLFYPILSKRMVLATAPNTFCSINHFVALQITCYVILAFVSTVLYLCVNNVIAFSHGLGIVLLYGALSIALCGVIIAWIIRKVTNRNRIQTLHKLELQHVLDSLTDLYELTASNGAVGNWFTQIGKQKLASFTDDKYSSPQDLAFLLIEFEKNILFDRLKREFVVKERDLWIEKLLLPNNFDDFIPLIQQLQFAIRSPPYFTLCMKTLQDECDLFKDSPKDICFLIMQFAIDCKNIVEIGSQSLLHSNAFPEYNVNHTIVERISAFGAKCDDELKLFVDALDQIGHI